MQISFPHRASGKKEHTPPPGAGERGHPRPSHEITRGKIPPKRLTSGVEQFRGLVAVSFSIQALRTLASMRPARRGYESLETYTGYARGAAIRRKRAYASFCKRRKWRAQSRRRARSLPASYIRACYT